MMTEQIIPQQIIENNEVRPRGMKSNNAKTIGERTAEDIVPKRAKAKREAAQLEEETLEGGQKQGTQGAQGGNPNEHSPTTSTSSTLESLTSSVESTTLDTENPISNEEEGNQTRQRT
ncbi:hypothetical protein FS749_014811 [Ceratobasidium sp. UAMH 11750]|nr:hypothetical protein FS749_014811 [Ceratobasidium sp. UAMH 11750]